MSRVRTFLKTVLTPVTVMLVPHCRTRAVSVRVPVLAVAATGVFSLAGVVFVVVLSAKAMEYQRMKERLADLSTQFHQMKGTMLSLKQAEQDFRKLFALQTRSAVLEVADYSDSGSLDMGALREQIGNSMQSVTDIRKYLVEQKDIFLATPSGWPVEGRLSSPYGFRNHPMREENRFHTGVDISVPSGTGVKATANGIVTFAGWSGNGGIVVVVGHGQGYSTAYAHNDMALVRVGQRVARGEAIARSGSTGVSTGPHVHYEIWKNGQHVNPAGFLARR